MQGLTDSPREGLTAAQVRDLLTGQGVTRGYGCDLLDSSNRFVADLSADVPSPWRIGHDNTAAIHRSVNVDLTRELAWGVDRIRPWLRLSKGGVSAKFYRGVFLLSTPRRTYGRTPAVFSCSGKDLLSLLNRQVGDTHEVAADGTLTYFTALRDILAAQGLPPPLLDGTRQGTVIPATRVWALGNTAWLDICNDLLAEIGYTDLFMSGDGTPRAQPITPVESRPPEWTFDTSDASVDLLAADYGETQDLWAGYNQWRFVRRGLAYEPTVGDGIYDVTNQSEGLASVDSIGLNPAPVQWLDVADQAALVAEGDRIVAADRRVEHEFSLRVDPLPIADHRDVVELRNERGVFKMLVSRWDETPYGKGTWVLGGGGGAESRETAETQATATVTQSAPLRVVVDGATADSLANALDAATYAVGDRVTVTVRNPRPPLVQGQET
jgi:hypothetical protein